MASIALISDDPARWQGDAGLADGVRVYHRDDLDAVQREFRELAGVSAIVYEQTCAAEKRRRRKRGELPDPDRRLFINHRVCEGCGDCSVQSNCIAVEPLETPLGRKRAINQSACNKDFSCVKGFCPSFVEIEGVQVRKPDKERLKARERDLFASVPEPIVPTLTQPFNVYVTGIGGSGVLTMGALIGSAAHSNGLAATVLDFTGLAQKNGAVGSQVRIASSPAELHAARIGDEAVDLLLGADLVVSAAADTLTRLSANRTAAIVNLAQLPTADGVRDRDASLPVSLMHDRVFQRCRESAFHAFDASALAQMLFGDTLPTHTLMLGYAWQLGLVPLTRPAIERVIEMGAAVELNKRAFAWGRVAAVNPRAVKQLDGGGEPGTAIPRTLDEIIDHRARELTDYQNAAYARRYRSLVGLVRNAESEVMPGSEALAMAVATSAYRLMAYKDEYEVARLYSSADFKASVSSQFSSTKKMSLWLAPPMLSRIDGRTGRPKKRKFGPWVFPTLAALARLRGLRGTPADVFGYTSERRAERRLIAEYFADVENTCARLATTNHASAVELASLAEQIRGFGPVKAAAMEAYALRRAGLLRLLSAGEQAVPLTADIAGRHA